MLKIICNICIVATISLSINYAHAGIFSSRDKEFQRVDEYLSRTEMFQAIKEVDIEEYEKFRLDLKKHINAKKSQKEINALAGNFTNYIVQKRLANATDSTAIRYVQFKADFFKSLERISPSACYDTLVTGSILDDLPIDMQEKIRAEQEMMNLRWKEIISAPLRKKPALVDKALATRWIVKIRSSLSEEEIMALGNEGKARVDKAAYCRAFNQFYSKALQLPKATAVQVFRELGEIP